MSKTTRLVALTAAMLVMAALAGCAGMTLLPPLFRAVDHDDVTQVQALLSQGADANATDSYGVSLLQASVDEHRKANLDIARLLIAHGADVNHKDVDGNSPLMEAACGGFADMVRLLLAHGADPNIRDNAGDTARDCAAKYHHPDIVAMFDVHPIPFNAAAFAKVAADYRTADPKPVPSAQVHRLSVQALDAVNHERFADAVNDYGKALEIAPWWPEGWFNRALILSKLGMYGPAVINMRNYLALVPDAANAAAVRDKIYVWLGRAKDGQ